MEKDLQVTISEEEYIGLKVRALAFDLMAEELDLRAEWKFTAYTEPQFAFDIAKARVANNMLNIEKDLHIKINHHDIQIKISAKEYFGLKVKALAFHLTHKQLNKRSEETMEIFTEPQDSFIKATEQVNNEKIKTNREKIKNEHSIQL